MKVKIRMYVWVGYSRISNMGETGPNFLSADNTQVFQAAS